MITFNLCFIKQSEQILLLNREKPSWMGCWNGVGGKLLPGESPRDSVIREIEEETGLTSFSLAFKGMVTWTVDRNRYGGMYIYLADIPSSLKYPTPVKTREGILDWKQIDWILNPANAGVASNLPTCLQYALKDNLCYAHHCIFENGKLEQIISETIDPNCETDDQCRENYLRQHTEKYGPEAVRYPAG